MRWLAVGEAGKEGGDGVPPEPIGFVTQDAQILKLGEAVGRYVHLPDHRLQLVPRVDHTGLLTAADRASKLIECIACDRQPLLRARSRERSDEAVRGQLVALWTLHRPATVRQRKLDHVGARILTARAGLEKVAVGVPDPKTGETPMAFAVLSGPADACDLMAWAAERLAEYSAPAQGASAKHR
jgi:acyl-CoA synthetase (AMP-forming)/AMP-acid ligase II